MTVAILSQKLTEYATMVQAMRDDQKAWFDHKDYNALNRAKKMEKQVDQATAAILENKPTNQQPTLF